ncbi:hypothetical protein [Bosea psychrotolerans]|uniref:Uncharacterized protein n=1 Tax=Bosea psychrotolerans TaxID=1871628 RepID=A0A2S4LUJ6_9HYPH|nr:hypothetical protein [Bosea psychrotolerans]POR46122.1 hypothetical protein CYD53_12736 [Bosea psychrotolerans]
MRPLAFLWRSLSSWFARAVPAQAGCDPTADEALRKSIHDVTHEQLGIAHWSCHTQF